MKRRHLEAVHPRILVDRAIPVPSCNILSEQVLTYSPSEFGQQCHIQRMLMYRHDFYAIVYSYRHDYSGVNIGCNSNFYGDGCGYEYINNSHYDDHHINR